MLFNFYWLTGGNHYEITYNKIVTHLLPAPYQINCFDYHQIGCKSRSDCIDKCNIEMSLKKCSELPVDTNVDRHNDKNINNLWKCCINYDGSVCEDKYKSPNCLNWYFSIQPFSVVILNKSWISKYKMNKVNVKAVAAVTIKFSHQPYIIYIHSPQQTIIEFIFSIRGILGLWIGFYVMIIYIWKIFGSQNYDSTQKTWFTSKCRAFSHLFGKRLINVSI